MMGLHNAEIAMLLLLIPALLTVYFGLIRPGLNEKGKEKGDDEK